MLLLRESRPKPNPSYSRQLELGSLGFGGLENGNAGIGVFPCGEELLVGGFSLRVTTLQLPGARELEARQYTDR